MQGARREGRGMGARSILPASRALCEVTLAYGKAALSLSMRVTGIFRQSAAHQRCSPRRNGWDERL